MIFEPFSNILIGYLNVNWCKKNVHFITKKESNKFGFAMFEQFENAMKDTKKWFLPFSWLEFENQASSQHMIFFLTIDFTTCL